jgi:hypothetical protein
MARLRLLQDGCPVWWAHPGHVQGLPLRHAVAALSAIDLRRCLPATERDTVVAWVAVMYQFAATMYSSWRRIRRASDELGIAEVSGVGETVVTAIRRVTALRTTIDSQILTQVRRGVPELAAALDLDGPRGFAVGAMGASMLARHIVHPFRFSNVRSLWRYAGLGVHEGRAQRRWSGQKTTYTPGFHSALRSLVAGSWSRRPCYWSNLHKTLLPEFLAKHAAGCGCRSKTHVANMAWREVLRRWLADAWIGWRAGMLRYYDSLGIDVSGEWL